MARITVFSTGICPICDITKSNLRKWKIPFEEVRVDQDRDGLRRMLELTNHARTVPQIVVDGQWIGGFNELTELHMDGGLEGLQES